jgi:exonuclease VII large subunit
MSRWTLSFAAAVVTGSMAAQAHHSISSVYDGSRRLTIEGTVAQFQLINPHPFLFIDVKDANGQVQQWRLEMDNRFELVAIGVTATTFKPGDKVVVTGSAARVQPHGLYVWRLDRPADGFWYEQVGSSPRIANTR